MLQCWMNVNVMPLFGYVPTAHVLWIASQKIPATMLTASLKKSVSTGIVLVYADNLPSCYNWLEKWRHHGNISCQVFATSRNRKLLAASCEFICVSPKTIHMRPNEHMIHSSLHEFLVCFFISWCNTGCAECETMNASSNKTPKCVHHQFSWGLTQ